MSPFFRYSVTAQASSLQAERLFGQASCTASRYATEDVLHRPNGGTEGHGLLYRLLWKDARCCTSRVLVSIRTDLFFTRFCSTPWIPGGTMSSRRKISTACVAQVYIASHGDRTSRPTQHL